MISVLPLQASRVNEGSLYKITYSIKPDQLLLAGQLLRIVAETQKICVLGCHASFEFFQQAYSPVAPPKHQPRIRWSLPLPLSTCAIEIGLRNG